MKHVLIMEDNLSLAFDWRDTFVLNGYEVTLCHSGQDAVAHLEQTQFDLVITDMFVTTGRGGLHVIAKLATMRKSAPPAIAVTGARTESLDSTEANRFLEQARRLGASRTIEKPFPAADLLLLAEEFFKLS